MLGAVIGDIVGSRFEFSNLKRKEFPLFAPSCRFTDDTVMTLAVARALTETTDPEALPRYAVQCMQEMGRKNPGAGYGGRFYDWIFDRDPQPYNSWGNGAGMRVSPCAWAADSLEEALRLSDAVTAVTHNHPEGIKGARAVTAAVFLARAGSGMEEIRRHIEANYYRLDFTLDGIRPRYRFDVSCQGSVPQAIEAFLESTGFEDAVRGAVSIGGDSDTIADMAGAIAGAYWGIPAAVRRRALDCLSEEMKGIVADFKDRFEGW